MTPSTIIERATAEGVNLSLSSAGTIKAIGENTAVNRWLELIRKHKLGIMAVLQLAANDAQLTAEQEIAVLAWLAYIDETDPLTIAEILNKCRTDPGSLAYFLRRAEDEPSLDDDRRRCSQCANLSGRGVCLAAHRGEIVASRSYAPIRDLLRRCEAYLPKSSDPYRRPGRERRPEPLQNHTDDTNA